MAVPVKKLEDQLNCPICLDTFTNPKQLQCHHVYCQQCLVKIVVRDQQGQLTLTCPNCRQVTPVPASGVRGLQSAFQINKLLEIVEEHKKVAASTESVEITSSSLIAQGGVNVVCPEHGGKEVNLYCETCEETICWECIMKESKHHTHECKKLKEAFENYKEEIASSLEPLEKQLETIEKALNAFDTRHDKISGQCATIKTDIHNTITQLQTRLHQTLEVRRTELINQLDQLTQAKLKSLAAQKDQLETTQAQLSSCLHFLKENLMAGNQGEALMMKATTVRQVKELTTTFQPDMLEPNAESDLVFSAPADLSAEWQNYGIVYAAGPPDPSKCCILSKGVDTAAVEEKSTAILQSFNSDGRPCSLSTTSISCELVSKLACTRVEVDAVRTGQNQYEISYQPNIKGRHQLHIKVNGQHIRDSPFPVSVRSPVEKLSTPILTIGVKEPCGVAINKKGEVIVVEESGSRVSVFSPSGSFLRSFATNNSVPRYHRYSSLATTVDGGGNILLGVPYMNCIQKFTAHGKFLTQVGTSGSGPLQFKNPSGIAASPSNSRVYVADNGNNRIQILSSEFSYISEFGKKGDGSGQFKYPWYVTCDSTGNVYVADCGNKRIQVFTGEGKFLRMFGAIEESKINLGWACGIAIDFNDRVYVGDEWNCKVNVFTSEGQLVTTFGSRGEGPGQFRSPVRLAVDNSGIVYVCDSSNYHIQLF